ncbi:MAG TPA: HEAT repeat domain-containing protein [Gemmataceae bacterium]|jgi:tetratricopeptide (TPR) repeat protein|nr:HEAT repeat domain-containing protein [Gemmataceae bacterium]
MGLPLLLEYYNELPEPRGEHSNSWEKRLRIALEDFRNKIQARYAEGTLQRLAGSTDVRNRRAAILALGMIGSMKVSNAYVAARLHDEDAGVRQLASDALWSMWFRADTEENNAELQKALEIRDRRKRRGRLDALIAKAPQFAEVLNQRAILHFENEDWALSISDCERALRLNPFHFGAAAGMGRCYIKLRKNRAALKAFRTAIRVNPTLGDVEEAIRALENALGEEGRRDDKK